MRLTPTIVVLAALMAVPATAPAQPAGVDGFRGDLLDDLAVLEQKFVSLADAIPATDFGWRPMPGVRSVAEVYGHVADANYMFMGMFGSGRPANVGIPNAPATLERVQEKEQLVALLRRVFPYVRSAIEATPDSALDREIQLFGSPSTVRAAMLMMITHMHEHLGQSIAYARSLGVTPPWSR